MKYADPVEPSVVDAKENLQRLERQMVRFWPRDKDYESKRRALQAAIQQLQKLPRRDRVNATK